MIFTILFVSVVCLRDRIYILDIPVLMLPLCWGVEYGTVVNIGYPIFTTVQYSPPLELPVDDTNVSKHVGVIIT